MGVQNPKAWVLVPVEPTPKMVAAWMCDHRNWSDRYAAMLSATPTIPVDGGEVVATSWKYHDRDCVDFKFAPDPYALERGFLTDIEPLVRQSALLAVESRALSLEEEVKTLREALKPFAKCSEVYPNSRGDGNVGFAGLHDPRCPLTFDDYHRARQALSEGEQA